MTNSISYPYEMDSTEELNSDSDTQDTVQSDVGVSDSTSEIKPDIHSDEIMSTRSSSTIESAPYGYRGDGLARLKPGRKPTGSPEERRQKQNAYHREYYSRMRKLCNQAKGCHDQMVKPFRVNVVAPDFAHLTYKLNTMDDYIVFINQLLEEMAEHDDIRSYNTSINTKGKYVEPKITEFK